MSLQRFLELLCSGGASGVDTLGLAVVGVMSVLETLLALLGGGGLGRAGRVRVLGSCGAELVHVFCFLCSLVRWEERKRMSVIGAA